MKDLNRYPKILTRSLFLCIMLFFIYGVSPCAKGCLKCNESGDACLICDSASLYNLNSEGVCVLEKIDNCLMTVHTVGKSECLQCDTEMVWDVTAQKCIEVPNNIKINGCLLYSQAGECSRCDPQYYFKNGVCNEAAIEVEHCLEFSDKAFCSVCEGARKFNPDNGKCEDFEPITNCMGHIDYICDKCYTGKYLEYNFFNNMSLFDNFNKPNLNIVYDKEFRVDLKGLYRLNPFDICKDISFTNCKTYTEVEGKITGCDLCLDGHLKGTNGSCVPYPYPAITNCKNYSNGTSCSQCVDGFYLDVNECKVRTTVENCAEYLISADECSKCLETHFLQNATTCSSRTVHPITNCMTASNTSDACSQCNSGFRETTDELGCLPIISECSIYEDSTKTTTAFKCTTCNTGYYVDDTGASCPKQNIENCNVHETNKNSCDICDSNYYKDGTTIFTCLQKNLVGCKIYKSGDENKCSVCENLYSLNITSETCEALTDTNCILNTTNTTTCNKCKSGFYLNAGTCTSSNKTYDSLCVAGNDVDGQCIECSNGYIPFKLNLYIDNLPSGCSAADTNTGICTQCAENKDGTAASGDNPPTCANAANTAGKCLQLKADIFEALVDNDGNCAVCRDVKENYLSSNTCTGRPFYNKLNCDIYETDAANCHMCKSGFSPQTLTEQDPVCVPNEDNASLLDGCLVHDLFDLTTCLMCQKNKKLNGQICEDTTLPADFEFKFVYNGGLNKISPISEIITSPITNCVKYASFWSGGSNAPCVECSTGFILRTNSTYFAINNSTTVYGGFSLIVADECADVSTITWIKKSSSDVNGSVSNCAVVKLAGGNVATDVLCEQCNSGYVPTFGNVAFNSDSSSINLGDVTPIYACTPAGDLGLSTSNSSQINTTNTYTPAIKKINHIFDTCSTSGQSPIYMTNNPVENLTSAGVSGSEVPSIQCMDIASVSQDIANCKVYAHDFTGLAVSNTGLTNLKCLICEPGFTVSSDLSGCNKIENCDTSNSSTNNLNNACNVCSEGYVHEIDPQNSVFGKTSCIEIPNDEKNCMFANSTLCIICKKNYTFDYETEKCVEVASSCSSKGFPFTNMHTISSQLNSNATLKNITSSIINYHFADELLNGPISCNTCDSGSSLYMTTSSNTDKEICLGNEYNKELTEGCTKYYGLISEKCSECKSEYILDEDTDTCIRRSENPNYYKCDILKSHDDEECKQCKRGYLPDSSLVCRDDHNCLDSPVGYNISNKCQKCEEGYELAFDTNFPAACRKSEYSENECVQWSSNGYCIACTDERKLPITNKDENDYEKKTICVFNKSARNANDYYLKDYRFEIDSNNSYKHLGYLNVIPSTGKFIRTIFADGTALSQYVCIRGPTDPFCSTWESNKYKCNSCKLGFFYNEELERCVKGRIEGCLEYDDENSCDTCDIHPNQNNDYLPYYELGSSCGRHKSQSCKIYTDDDPSCEECKNGYIKDPETNKYCIAVTKDKHCTRYTNDNSTCVQCETGYYKSSSDNMCYPYTVKNCLNYNSNKDECSSCIENYYLISENVCVINTAENCLTKSTTSNSCATCPEDGKTYYSLAGTGCYEITLVENCVSYKTDQNKCNSCNEGFYLDQNVCTPNPSGVINCSKYSDMSTCSECGNGYFLASNICSQVTNTVTDCLVYSADGVCAQCIGGRIKATDGSSCSTPNEPSCATWTDTDNCATCVGNTYLFTNDDSKQVCKPTNIAHCLEVSPGTNPPVCQKCAPGFILREGKCDSPKIIVLDCEEYNVETEVCESCFDGYLLSADKNKCSVLPTNEGDFCVKAHIPEDKSLVCNICNWGHMRDNEGNCVQCGGEGCAICDANDNQKCSLCNKGYYMGSTKTCSLNNPPEVTNIKITSMLLSIALFILLIKWDN